MAVPSASAHSAASPSLHPPARAHTHAHKANNIFKKLSFGFVPHASCSSLPWAWGASGGRFGMLANCFRRVRSRERWCEPRRPRAANLAAGRGSGGGPSSGARARSALGCPGGAVWTRLQERGRGKRGREGRERGRGRGVKGEKEQGKREGEGRKEEERDTGFIVLTNGP